MNIRQSGTSLIAWEGGAPRAQIVWNEVPRGWYVNFLASEHPGLLAPLLARFRRVWRDSGRPVLEYHTTPGNYAMQRLTGLLGARRSSDLYRVTDLTKEKTNG